MSRGTLAACIKQAAQQYGVITRAQAMRAGLSEAALQRLVLANVWKRVFPATYALWTPRTRDERWRQQLIAGVLWLGEGSAVSHRAAAVIWGLDGIVSAPLEFSTEGRRRPTRDDVFVYRGASLTGQIVRRSGLPVTTVSQTLVGLASVVGPHVLDLAFESGLRQRLTSIGRIRAALELAHPRQRGRGALRRLIEQYPGNPTGSALEVMFWQLIRDSPLPMPVRQYRIRDASGVVVARPDFAYPEHRIAMEMDGVERHSDKLAVTRDRRRQNQIAVLGWVPYRLTKEDVRRHPRRVVAEITQLLKHGHL